MSLTSPNCSAGKKRSQSEDEGELKSESDGAKRFKKSSIQLKLAQLKSNKNKITIPLGKTRDYTTSLASSTNAKRAIETPKPKVAAIFSAADDSDDEPEQMPAECRMRMRNIGRDTPTSCGPNSFGKTKYGFCDSSKLFEKNLKLAMDSVSNDNSGTKLSKEAKETKEVKETKPPK